MLKIISFIRDRNSEIYKGMLIILSIIIIVYLFPKQEKFKYEFKNLKGKPWYYENLVAPFDFAITKSKEELDAERTEVSKNAKLYFRLDHALVRNKLDNFEKEFNAQWPLVTRFGQKEKNHKLARALIDSIYDKGIIQIGEVIENKPRDFSLYELDNNIAIEKELGNFYTIHSADQFIQEELNKERNKVDANFLLSLLDNSIAQNILFDLPTTSKFKQQSLDEISLTLDPFLKGQSIISNGEIVDAKKYKVLESLQTEYEKQSGGKSTYFFILLGQLIIVCLCLAILIAFLALFRKDIFLNNTKITFILFQIVLVVLISCLSLKIGRISIYLLPFCILPIIIRAFYDTRVALFVHLVTILMIGFLSPNRFEFVFIQLVAGIVAILSIVNMRNRSQISVTAAIIFLSYCFSYLGIMIIQDGGLSAINLMDIGWFAGSALLTLMAYPLIFIFEKMFGFISDVSLMELSDTNSPLLRELASKAPGTFQHSLQVANLVEETIYRIGGNTLLVRTGALYHDIGKMDAPMYFIENQSSGINPHEDLAYEESAAIIIGHVINGIEKAKKHKIPEIVIDFIRTHHGTTMADYFFRSFKNAYPEEKLDPTKFQYPGPIPFSKETAVLMMADSVEAASRSLKKYDEETIGHLVESIINNQIEKNQFINADITFKDITQIKKILKKKLMNIYHLRIEYPK